MDARDRLSAINKARSMRLFYQFFNRACGSAMAGEKKLAYTPES
tara:strand:+ start:280 stop:411 length:132 start_codon:yes stop_codon:yes gene_type:complete